MLFTFLSEYLQVIGIFIGLTLIGGFAIIPFRDSNKYIVLSAPLAGLMLLSLGTSLLYTLMGLSLLKAALLTAIICSAFSFLAFLYFYPIQINPFFILIMLVLIALVTYLNDYLTISSGQPWVFARGDQVFYSLMSDWISTHYAQGPPFQIEIPDEPKKIWIDLLIRRELRSGSYFILGIIAALHRESALFSYDIACAIILSASYIAVAAVFSRSRTTFLLLLIGLMLSCWFDFGRTGYFGKILGLPAIFLIVGLYLNIQRPFTTTQIVCLAILTCGASTVYPGYAIAFLLLMILGIFLVVQAISNPSKTKLRSIWDDAMILILLMGIAIATSGVLSKHVAVYPLPEYGGSWFGLILSLFNLRYDSLAGLTKIQLIIVSGFFALSVFWMFVLSCIKRELTSFILILSPTVTIICFMMFNQLQPAYQLIGVVFPLYLIGSLRLIDSMNTSVKAKSGVYLASLMAIFIMIAVHLPRIISTADNFTRHVDRSHTYSKMDFEMFQKLIGKFPVTIHIHQAGFIFPILVELGRRHVTMQWTPEGWDAITHSLSFLSAPKLDKSSHLMLTSAKEDLNQCAIKYKTTQYKLVDCTNL